MSDQYELAEQRRGAAGRLAGFVNTSRYRFQQHMGGGLAYGCSLTASGTISVPTGLGSPTKLTWDMENFKSQPGMHSTTVNPSRIYTTIAGQFFVAFNTAHGTQFVTGVARRSRVLVNGVAQFADIHTPDQNQSTDCNLVVVLGLKIGDYVEVDADQDSGHTINVTPVTFVLFLMARTP